VILTGHFDGLASQFVPVIGQLLRSSLGPVPAFQNTFPIPWAHPRVPNGFVRRALGPALALDVGWHTRPECP
jgi:hypothetical protein